MARFKLVWDNDEQRDGDKVVRFVHQTYFNVRHLIEVEQVE